MRIVPEINKDVNSRLREITCFALDMDGTIYLGEQWIDGAREFLAAVEKENQREVLFGNIMIKNSRIFFYYFFIF